MRWGCFLMILDPLLVKGPLAFIPSGRDSLGVSWTDISVDLALYGKSVFGVYCCGGVRQGHDEELW